MTMTTERFIEILEEAGANPTAYSGRGMYGAQCVSTTMHPADILEAAWGDTVSDDEELYFLAQKLLLPTTDQMGRDGTVYYWRSCRWPQNEEE